jgi:predicted phosphate transport protein (TIGR00153 family)
LRLTPIFEQVGMSRRLFGWFAPKRGEKVLSMVEQHLELTKRAVSDLYNMVEAAAKGGTEAVGSFYDSLSQMEMKADALRRDIVEELSRSEMFPEERQDLMELVRAVDWVADWSREAGRILSVIPYSRAPHEIKVDAQNMCRADNDCVSVLSRCINTLMKDVKEALNLANEVEVLEEEIDELYRVARGHIATLDFEGFTTGSLILLNMFFDALETIADWCENTADIVRAIAVRIK